MLTVEQAAARVGSRVALLPHGAEVTLISFDERKRTAEVQHPGQNQHRETFSFDKLSVSKTADARSGRADLLLGSPPQETRPRLDPEKVREAKAALGSMAVGSFADFYNGVKVHRNDRKHWKLVWNAGPDEEPLRTLDDAAESVVSYGGIPGGEISAQYMVGALNLACATGCKCGKCRASAVAGAVVSKAANGDPEAQAVILRAAGPTEGLTEGAEARQAASSKEQGRVTFAEALKALAVAGEGIDAAEADAVMVARATKAEDDRDHEDVKAAEKMLEEAKATYRRKAEERLKRIDAAADRVRLAKKRAAAALAGLNAVFEK